MVIEIVEAEQVRSGRGGKTKGEKYGKYAIAIQKHIPYILDQIKESKDGKIRIKTEAMGKEMGGEFIKKNPTSIYWGLRYVLFQEGIVVETGTLAETDGGKVLIMRLADTNDRLPPSLAKYLEPAEEEENGPEPEE